MNWLKKLWNGDFSLPLSFWVFLVLISNVGGAALIVLSTLTGSVIIILSALLIDFTYAVVALVGTWKSAQKYTGWKGWAIAVQVLLVLSALKFFIDALQLMLM